MLFSVLVRAEARVGALSVHAVVPAGGAAAPAALVNIHTLSSCVFLEAFLTRQADGAEVGGGVVQQPPHSRRAPAANLHQDIGPALHRDPFDVVMVQNDGAEIIVGGMLTWV